MFRNVYESDVCRAEDEKAYYIVERLYKYYLENINKMPDTYVKIANEENAGMSDTFALREYNRLFIPKFAEF